MLFRSTIKNPRHVSTGVAELIVDGVTVEGNVIPVVNDGNTHVVEVIMG